MYLRNVKQILRAGSFDERRYGFGGLLDLLKACQREGLVRVERDRRGGLRVFQGPAFARTSAMPTIDPATLPRDVELDADNDDAVNADVDAEIIRVAVVSAESEAIEAEPIDVAPVSVVDTTAELLGRASARRPRTRSRTGLGDQAAPAPSPRAARSTGAKKRA